MASPSYRLLTSLGNPVRRKRYTWGFPRRREMTIAAGFVYKDGVLLCADTQQEGGAIKFDRPKIGLFECPGGKVAFALAGNVQFAMSAIQKCADGLKVTEPQNTITTLEAILEHEYRRHVYDHPRYKEDDALGYSFLICFWPSGSEATSLFVTHEHALDSCFERFDAVGSGLELAYILARPFIYHLMSEEDALILAAYVLARVKSAIPGCGGDSQFVVLRNDGTCQLVLGIKLDQIADIATKFDKAAHLLLFAMNQDSDEAFQQAIDSFSHVAKSTRAFWKSQRLSGPAEQLYPLLTTTGYSRPLP
jgi:20S proteasome alpha/beta subunit